MEKKFCKSADEIRPLIPDLGGCLATDRILVDGAPVGYMYREVPEGSVHSGWVFTAGDEDQAYIDQSDHWAIYEVNTICNYDPAIIPYLDQPVGSALVRIEGSDEFEAEGIPFPDFESESESESKSEPDV